MWKDINNYINIRYKNKLHNSNYSTITPNNGWGDDSSSIGFIFCPINIYKNALKYKK